MKRIMCLASALALGTLANSAGAALIVDTVAFSAKGTQSSTDLDGYGYGDVNRLDGILDYVSWTHHFDFDGGVQKIHSGILSLDLRDDGGLLDGIELAFGYTDSGQWDVGLVSTRTYSYDVSLASLLDGSLSVKLISLIGDFFIDKSVLRVEYTPVAQVPEPATLSLLGLGLLAVAFGCGRKVQRT